MKNSPRRRSQSVAHDNHERWLVSYADFVTLLFAFFVVMFASSRTDTAKIQALSRSVSDAFQGQTREFPRDGADVLARSSEALQQSLADEIASGKISLNMEARGLVISLKESAFFSSGSEVLLAAAIPSVDKIATIIGRLPNPIRLEGHTDSRPIRNERFKNNWELSAARGVAVLELFHGAHGIDIQRLAVVGYADTMPKSSNETDEGRASNRRVDVTILNESGKRQEATDKVNGS